MAKIDGSGFDSGKALGDDELGQPVTTAETVAAQEPAESATVERPSFPNVTPIRPPSESPILLSAALADTLERAASWLRKLGGGKA